MKSGLVEGATFVPQYESTPGPPDNEAEGAGLVTGQNKKPILAITFHIETLRLIAVIMFDVVMIVCSVLTKHYVEIATEDTVIYKLFGFNHACNVLDHHPAREVGAILIVFMILPFATYIFLAHKRTWYAYECGRVPRWLYIFSTAVTPFNFISVCWCYMVSKHRSGAGGCRFCVFLISVFAFTSSQWFVNNPDDDYGFLAHYIPYLTFQIMLALVAFQQVAYLACIDKLPCSVSPKIAWAYVVFLTALTIVYAIYVISILADNPVWDSVNNEADRLFAQIVSKVYSVFVLIFPVVFAFIERRNGDLNTITFS